MKQDSFIFYRSFYDSLLHMSKRQQFALVMAILQYAFEGEKPQLPREATAVFCSIKPQIDANNRRRSRFVKEQGQAATNANNNDKANDNVNSNVNDNDKGNENKKTGTFRPPQPYRQQIMQLRSHPAFGTGEEHTWGRQGALRLKDGTVQALLCQISDEEMAVYAAKVDRYIGQKAPLLRPEEDILRFALADRPEYAPRPDPARPKNIAAVRRASGRHYSDTPPAMPTFGLPLSTPTMAAPPGT